jgi:hypothetical protein
MRKEVILAVADAIEKHELEVGFNMGVFVAEADEISGGDMSGHGCGTVECLAGWTVLLFDQQGKRRNMALKGAQVMHSSDILISSAEAMGITSHEADQLFLPSLGSDVSSRTAANVLRRLAETGEVDWS